MFSREGTIEFACTRQMQANQSYMAELIDKLHILLQFEVYYWGRGLIHTTAWVAVGTMTEQHFLYYASNAALLTK